MPLCLRQRRRRVFDWFHRIWSGARVGPLAVVAVGTLLGWGCSANDPCEGASLPYSASTLIGGLYDACFPRCPACDSAAVNALLYLDTGSLPTVNGNVPKLVLSSRPIGPGGAGRDRLEYFFPDTLPASIDPGIRDQSGWKVRVSGVTLEYCDDCVTNCGLVPILRLRGELSSVTFVRDPGDTSLIYIDRHPRARQ
jgi:hypothetical protein